MTIRKLCLLVGLLALLHVTSAKAEDCNNDGIDDLLQLDGCVFYWDRVFDVLPRSTLPDSGPFSGIGDSFYHASVTTICDIDVHVKIDHEWNGDLSISLRHQETGTEVLLVDRPGHPAFPDGYSSTGLSITLDDEAQASIETADVGPGNTINGVFKPHPGSLSDFHGEPIEGVWTIRVTDGAQGNIGTLDGWGALIKSYDPRGNDCNLNDVPDECDPDADGDGTPDDCDDCPNDQNKTDPGVCGCGTPDADTDEDGTPDCNDDCPNDQNKTGPGICGCGVSDADTDTDGTPDCNDECPVQ